MERAEAALRERPLTALRLLAGGGEGGSPLGLRVPVLFEEVAVRFSQQEWAHLDEGQKEMYRSVMEGNYEMLVSLYCALSKPELLLQLEREELSAPPESEPEAAEASPELAVEPARQNCASDEALLETETMRRGCREPEESGNGAENSGNSVGESENLVEKSRSPVKINENLGEDIWDLTEESEKMAEQDRSPAGASRSPAEENRSPAEENRSLAEENRSPAEENRSLAEENRSLAEENRSLAEENGNPAEESVNLKEASRSPVVPENCSTRECLANPAAAAAAARSPESLPSCSSASFTAALGLAAPVPLEGAALLAELSQAAPSPPRPLSVQRRDAVGQNSSPPAAGDAEAGIPMEVPQEEVAAEKLSTPKTASKAPEEDKGLEEEAVKDSGNTGQDLVANIPEEPGKKVAPDIRRMTERADPSPAGPGKESCVGRPAAWQRNSARQFYSCPICRKTFLLKINLLIHQRGHTNWVPYVCVHCDRKFMSKKKIRRHLRAWAANGTCQPSELEVCPSQGPCPASHPQSWAANGTCQASKAEECPSQGPCPTSQPQAWAPNGSCQPSKPEEHPSQSLCPTSQCPTSQPQTWAPNGSCQPSDAKACPSQGPCPTSQCPTSQPQTWAPKGSCQPLDAKACPSQGTLFPTSQCPTSQPQTWAPNGMCQPSGLKVCPSQGPAQPQAWAPNSTGQPSDAKVCPSQGPCPTSQPQTWAPNGSCQPSDAKACLSQGPCPTSQCPTSQPQTWAPNGTCQPLDAKVCPSQGPCPTSQPQAWAPNGSCQPSKPEERPSQSLCPTSQCPTSQCPTSQPQTWAPNGSCQPSKPEERPSQSLCPSSQPQAPSRDCGTVWQEPGPARCSLPPGKMMYTCNECLETFSNQGFLTVHQRRHSGHHLILCPCCNRSFTWVSDFVRQHWTHMGVRPHQCGICQKTFKRFSHLKAHQRIHGRQQRPFCANPLPVVVAPAAGDGAGSREGNPQGWGAAVGP